MNLEEKVDYLNELPRSKYISIFEILFELDNLGFDWDKNSARDLIDCIVYMYDSDTEKDI